MRDHEVESAAHAAIQKGSKTFSLAARILDANTRTGVALLYSWCRFCDDLIDNMHDEQERTIEERLQLLRSWTELAFDPSWPVVQETPLPIVSLRRVVQQFQIPKYYLLELVEGMAMDVHGTTYETFDDLVLYCYRVAGVVGLMMSHIIGVTDAKALPHATDLGNGFQISNILRDVMDDAAMGRVYLPLAWLREFQIPATDIQNPIYRAPLSQLCQRLLGQAELFYASADQGYAYLPFWTAVTMNAARKMYSEIGRTVIRRGAQGWDQRAFVPLRRKLWLCLQAFGECVLRVRWFRKTLAHSPSLQPLEFLMYQKTRTTRTEYPQ